MRHWSSGWGLWSFPERASRRQMRVARYPCARPDRQRQGPMGHPMETRAQRFQFRFRRTNQLICTHTQTAVTPFDASVMLKRFLGFAKPRFCLRSHCPFRGSKWSERLPRNVAEPRWPSDHGSTEHCQRFEGMASLRAILSRDPGSGRGVCNFPWSQERGMSFVQRGIAELFDRSLGRKT